MQRDKRIDGSQNASKWTNRGTYEQTEGKNAEKDKTDTMDRKRNKEIDIKPS